MRRSLDVFSASGEPIARLFDPELSVFLLNANSQSLRDLTYAPKSQTQHYSRPSCDGCPSVNRQPRDWWQRQRQVCPLDAEGQHRRCQGGGAVASLWKTIHLNLVEQTSDLSTVLLCPSNYGSLAISLPSPCSPAAPWDQPSPPLLPTDRSWPAWLGRRCLPIQARKGCCLRRRPSQAWAE